MFSSVLRNIFTDFFKSKGHVIVPSASLVPPSDPSLLFTTAGMVPFKDIFTGAQTRPFPSAVSIQKCVRAGGKHNDLEQVGHTSRHHTFFEMCGNFSFGDYFKEEAIAYAWEFLTRVIELDPQRLWITVYHTDETAITLWKKIAGLSEGRIIKISTQDNFWSAGDTGPCGPCSEIFYDHGDHVAGGLPGTADSDGDRFVELWNLVFMEFEQVSPEERILLPQPSIDTGMGLERMAAVLQGVSDNFKTDILKSLVEYSACLSSTSIEDVAHRVIADHVRSTSFLIADGVLPSHEGRGYVVRRILRRALRHVHYLQASPSHMADLVPLLIEKMGDFYPELSRAQSLIESVLRQEGEKFKELLTKGLDLLSQWSIERNSVFSGHKAFQLYDTYGFPLDLTQDILKEKGCCVNEEEFYHDMNQQRALSRQSWIGSGSAVKEYMWSRLNEIIFPTEFVGYEKDAFISGIQKIFFHDQETQILSQGQEGLVITQHSPFYGESGGQVGDQGWIRGPHGRMKVVDTQKHGHLIVHKGIMEEGELLIGQEVLLVIDDQRRRHIRIHHSATHLLQAALRTVLGNHVTQKGSLVNADKLRFDFSHHFPLDNPTLDHIERLVNNTIWSDCEVTTRLMSSGEAIQQGAMALFGEQYEEQVRVITMGSFSQELCGGTHVDRTGQMGLFKILSDISVGSGIRRIEAVAGEPAFLLVQQMHRQIKNLASTLKTSPSHLEEKVKLLTEKKKQKPSDTSLKVEKKIIGNVAFWYGFFDDHACLKEKMDILKQQIESGILVFVSQVEEKVTLLVGVSKDLTPFWNAKTLLTLALGPSGKGGGRVDLAQGGGLYKPGITHSLIEVIERHITLYADHSHK